jgi:hypothetical protein
MMLRYVLLIGAMSACALYAQNVKESALGLCAVLADPVKYDGEVIQIKALTSGTSEGFWLSEPVCPRQLITEDHVWPNSIWIENPNDPLRIHTPNFVTDLASATKMEKEFLRLKRTTPESCIELVITGLFETRKDWSEAKAVYRDGSSKFLGFGHQAEAPAQILVKSYDEVRRRPGCKASKGKKR